MGKSFVAQRKFYRQKFCHTARRRRNFNSRHPSDKFLDDSPNEISALLDDCGIHIGNILLIYPRRHKLFVNGKAVLLTPIEFELLLILAAHLNKTLTTKEIYKNLRDKEDLNVTGFTLKTHISNLRKKLRTASDDKIQLKNCKGDGYCPVVSEP